MLRFLFIVLLLIPFLSYEQAIEVIEAQDHFRHHWQDYRVRKSDTLIQFKEGKYTFVYDDKALSSLPIQRIYYGGQNAYIVKTPKGFQILDQELKPCLRTYFDTIFISQKNYWDDQGYYSYKLENPKIHVFNLKVGKKELVYNLETRKISNEPFYEVVEIAEESPPVASVDQPMEYYEGIEPVDLQLMNSDVFLYSQKRNKKGKLKYNSIIRDEVLLLKTKNIVYTFNDYYAEQTTEGIFHLYWYDATSKSSKFLGNFIGLRQIDNRFLIAYFDYDVYNVFQAGEQPLFSKFKEIELFEYSYNGVAYNFFLVNNRFVYNMEGELVLEHTDPLRVVNYYIEEEKWNGKRAILNDLSKPITLKYDKTREYSNLYVGEFDVKFEQAKYIDLFNESGMIDSTIQVTRKDRLLYMRDWHQDLLYINQKDSTLVYDTKKAKYLITLKGTVLNYDEMIQHGKKVESKDDNENLVYAIFDNKNIELVIPSEYYEIAYDEVSGLYIALDKSFNIQYIKLD